MDAGKSSTTYGSGSPLIDVGIEGMLSADGVTFTSTGGAGAPGEWGSVVFNLQGSYNAAYGYLKAVQPVSRVKNSTIENADAGIRIVNHIAPGIENVQFVNSLDGKDIFVDGTDTLIPEVRDDPSGFVIDEAVWDLDAPMTIVLSNGGPSVNDLANFGTEERSDIVIQGKWLSDSASETDFVVIRPVTQNHATADDWGTLIFDTYATESDAGYLNIGHAANPVFAFYPDDVALRDSWVHHFAETGVWIQGALGYGVSVTGNVIERGSGLGGTLGNVGLFLDKAERAIVDSNVVDFSGSALPTYAGTGLVAAFSKTFCQSAPTGPVASQAISNNDVLGPGDHQQNGAMTGIVGSWLCGSIDRLVTFEDNIVEGWNAAGLDLAQSVDVNFRCNNVRFNEKAIDWSRNNEPTGNAIRFQQNNLEIDDDGEFVIRSDNGLKLKLGPLTTNRGDNELRTAQQTPFIVDIDATSEDLDARNNWWFEDGTQLDVLQDVEDLVSPNANDVLIVAPYADPPSGSCYRTTYLNASSRGAGSVAGTPISPALSPVEAVPSRTNLVRTDRNPGRGEAQLQLDVGANQQGLYQVTVYDVTGRRVTTLVDGNLAPGRYPLRWRPRDGGGTAVAAGVYFVRVTGPEYQKTEKVVLLQ
jgi:hypothetical protein